MPFVVRAFPVKQSTDDVRAFAALLAGERGEEMAQFFRHYGVRYESWHLQETPAGPWVLCVTQVDEPEEASARYANASEAFHAWFRERVHEITGIDPTVAPLGPATSEIFAWGSAVDESRS